jgi:leucyl-tRNA synthetase
VVNGCCWRHETTPVTKKELDQWFFKITDYAERLLQDLDEIDWPERIKLMQRNWIGKSGGASVIFRSEQGDPIEIFTTRPDTLFGATFMVLAPEHPLVEKLTTPDRKAEVQAYVEATKNKSDIDRLAIEKEKTGVFTGAYAINPVNNECIPIWTADYVLIDYGTGAIMCVPYGDERDYEFATKFGLEIRKIIEPANPQDYVEGQAYTGEGYMVNCGEYNGLHTSEFYQKIVAWLEQHQLGKRMVTYKMRDWLISRQRYWGAPIPIVHCEQCGTVPVPEDQVPVLLPHIDDFTPSGDGRSPLSKNADFVNTTCPQCGGNAKRETDTMDGFACSSWYFMRFPDPRNDQAPYDRKIMDTWLPVDLYIGGAEHAVMHLLYSRFWTKVMYDAGLIGFKEPFTMLRNQGMLHAADGAKMSKSKGNVITPDEMASEYGIDILRLYLLFMAPFEDDVNWSDEAIAGIARYLQRFYRLFLDDTAKFSPQPINLEFDSLASGDRQIVRKTHQTIKKVTEDMDRFHFNTAIAAMMELANLLLPYKEKYGITPAFAESCRSLLMLMAPFAPHVTEEIWEGIGGSYSIHQLSWIAYNEAWTKEDMITIVVQVNGKVRDKFDAPVDVSEDDAKQMALAREKVRNYTDNKTIVKVVYVRGRLINIVVK